MTLLLCAFGWSPALALVLDVEKRVPIAKRVALLHFKDYTVDSSVVFTPPLRVPEGQLLLRRYHRHLVDRIGAEGWLDLVDLRSRFAKFAGQQSYRLKLRNAHDNMKRGLDDYSDLKLQRAVQWLTKVQLTHLELFDDIVNPARMADVTKNLALAYLDQKGRDNTARAFRELTYMFSLHPTLQIKKGLYAKSIEDQFVAAHNILTHEGARLSQNLDNPLVKQDRLQRFMRTMDLDAVIYAYLIRINGKRQLQLLIYEKRTGSAVVRAEIDVDGASVAEVNARLGMALSRWLACTQFDYHDQRRYKFHRFYVNANFAWATFLKHSPLTRRVFSNLGFGFNFSWQIRKRLALFSKFNLWSSTRDPHGDLLQNFKTFRIMLGVGLTWQVKNRWRFYVRAALDALIFSKNFQSSTNPNCKFFPNPSESLCPSSGINRLDDQFYTGINVAVGAQLELARGIYLHLETNYTYYFWPFNKDAQLNSPISIEAGLGYRF